MHKLTDAQRNFAEENHNMIQDFLFYNQLDRADYYDVVVLGYLEAVQAYDEDSRTRQYKFETIALRKMCEDVYKRQDRSLPVRPRLHCTWWPRSRREAGLQASSMQSMPWIPCMPRISAWISITCTYPVSYTHLDVYKRQVWHRPLITDREL